MSNLRLYEADEVPQSELDEAEARDRLAFFTPGRFAITIECMVDVQNADEANKVAASIAASVNHHALCAPWAVVVGGVERLEDSGLFGDDDESTGDLTP